MNVRHLDRFIAIIALTTLSVVTARAESQKARPLPPLPANAVTITSSNGAKATIDPSRFHVFDIPDNRFEELTGIPPQWQTEVPPLGELSTLRGAATGKVLTLLVEWETHQASHLYHTPAAYDSLLYSTGIYPTGSVNDYYQEVSYGNFGITGEVVGWLNLISDYSVNYDINEIIEAADPYVNFADYDGDGDGFVDALWIVHAGAGQEETHNLNDIWSHARLLEYVPTDDGVAIDRWSMQPEKYANNDIMSIRVFAHEYGHILGLPDLYDYRDKLETASYYTPNDYNDHPLVDWDIMGYAGYNLMSYGTAECPTHFSAWSRVFLGWGTPETPACLGGTYQLYNVEEYPNQSIFRVPISDDGTEYFYLEYRNPRSPAKFDHLNSDFSAYFPFFTPGKDTLDSGLLVTQIDEKAVPNIGVPHYAVRVVDAGYDPAHPWDGVSEFSEWWYPYEFRIGALYSPDDPGQTLLSATTTPSSDGYDGPSGVTIEIIDQNPDYVTLNISRVSRPLFGPVAPVTLEEQDVENVTLTATDLNCTTPSLALVSTPPPPSFVSFNDLGDGSAVLTLTPQIGDAAEMVVGVVASDGVLADTIDVQVTITPTCVCQYLSDFDANSALDALDLNDLISALFFAGPNPQDPGCPNTRGDFDASGAPDAIDLNALIDHLFFGGPAPCDPCNPISSICAP